MKGRCVPINNELKNKLTVSPFNPGSPTVVKYTMYKLTNKAMYIPKYFSDEGNVIENKINYIPIEVKFQPRDYQKNIINTIYSEIKNKESWYSLFIHWLGKNFCGHLYSTSTGGVKTLVIVNKESLMQQWKDQIKYFTGIDAGIIQGIE